MRPRRPRRRTGALRRRLAAAALGLVLAGPAPARADEMARFIAANVIGALFHALGEALIATQVPERDPGKAEAQADALAVLLIERLYDAAQARELIGDMALALRARGQAADGADGGADGAGSPGPVPVGGHGDPAQRASDMLCLFLGGDPGRRSAEPDGAALAPGRAEACTARRARAESLWGPVLDDMAQMQGRGAIVYAPRERSFAEAVLLSEIAAFNAAFGLAAPLRVVVESCAAPQVRYEAAAGRIVFCAETEADLARLGLAAGLR